MVFDSYKKDSVVIKPSKHIEKKEGVLKYQEILKLIEAVDTIRGENVSGESGYFLTGIGVQLNYALQLYTLDYLRKRGYVTLQPPYYMHNRVAEELVDSADSLYSMHIDPEFAVERRLLSEASHAALLYHESEWLETKELPKKYAIVSTCFNNLKVTQSDLFNVKQHESVDQFYYSPPEKSWLMLEEMLLVAEEFYASVIFSLFYIFNLL
jgi:seryl-tRNA synthetase